MNLPTPSVYYVAFQALALGITWSLLLVGYRTMGRAFFRVNLAVILVFLGIGWTGLPAAASSVLAPVRGWHLAWLIAALAWTGLTALPGWRPVSYAYPIVAGSALGWYVNFLHWLRASLAANTLFAGVSLGLGSLLMGTVLVGMIVGHWYLIRRDLPIRVLVRVSGAYLALALARLLWAAGFTLYSWPTWSAAFEPFSLTTVLILQRWAFGLLLPPLFAWMILQTARLRSTQSATGILYAAVVVTLLGEFLGLYLWLHQGLIH